MIFSLGRFFVIVILFLCNGHLYALDPVDSPLSYAFSGSIREEGFFGKNTYLLNNNNVFDKTLFWRHIADFDMDVLRAGWCKDEPLLEFYCTIRNKGVWGDSSSIAATSSSVIKNVDSIIGVHSHFIPRHIFWMRELWIEGDLAQLLHLTALKNHFLKLGAFSFELGRGIALGDAYAVGPENLGFYTEAIVDQYAFGGKLTGEVVPDRLSYDLYAALLNSKTTTLGQTGERILGQEFGKRANPSRGFGVINYIVAGRVQWNILCNEIFGTFLLEPYWLYNSAPEQSIEFLGDASSKLGTIGFAGEYTRSCFEFGFDCAWNLGRQFVKSWDRNLIISENRDGRASFVNSHVVDQNNKKIPYVSDSIPAQQKIYAAFDNAYSQEKNGQLIAKITEPIGFLIGSPANPIAMKNSINRFRNPYVNKYAGWMAVADAAVYLFEKELQVAATAGVASGDENPNLRTHDSKYHGFIGLQEIYSGKRVRSMFVLGGAKKPNRPLSIPDEEQAPNPFADVVSGFTNIAFTGCSLLYKTKIEEHPISVMPNMLFYWQQKATRKFDASLRREINALASNYLGLEANVFAHYFPYPELKVFFVGSVFVPGKHYDDIKGLPLNKDQNFLLSQLDADGFTRERIPNIGDNVAYTMNIGIEYSF